MPREGGLSKAAAARQFNTTPKTVANSWGVSAPRGWPASRPVRLASLIGVRVVGLEKGPRRGRETFGGDELANINRYNLWPDPLLNPRARITTMH